MSFSCLDMISCFGQWQRFAAGTGARVAAAGVGGGGGRRNDSSDFFGWLFFSGAGLLRRLLLPEKNTHFQSCNHRLQPRLMGVGLT